MNACQFSPCRNYRYTLEHVWDEISEPHLLMWIGLNPSTADENALDPTLRRIRAFSMAWGYTGFVMTNLFAFRATDPAVMKAQADPIGPENDRHLMETAARCSSVVACWGTHGSHLSRGFNVDLLLVGVPLLCLGHNADLSPKHPLYVAADTELQAWEGGL